MKSWSCTAYALMPIPLRLPSPLVGKVVWGVWWDPGCITSAAGACRNPLPRTLILPHKGGGN
jgi:hypothetical protein